MNVLRTVHTLQINSNFFAKVVGCSSVFLSIYLSFSLSVYLTGMREHWAFYYNSPQSLLIKFSYSLAQQLLLNLYWLFHYISKHINKLLLSTEGIILCISNGDVHQYIGHCLIPLNF